MCLGLTGRVDGLQSDGWILLKCFRSELWLAHRDSLLGSSSDRVQLRKLLFLHLVGCPDTYPGFIRNARTALRSAVRSSRNPWPIALVQKPTSGILQRAWLSKNINCTVTPSGLYRTGTTIASFQKKKHANWVERRVTVVILSFKYI